MAQATKLSTRNWTSGQARETHPPRQATLMRGGSAMKSRQPKVQVRTSAQVITRHVPQSAVQFVQVSNSSDSQTMFPQKEQTPQSRAQLAQVSLPAQRPSPQPMQIPQSSGHVKQLSELMLQVPSPQVGQGSQSSGQVTQSSPRPGSQNPFSHVSQMPQSSAQLEQVSVIEQVPSPHATHRPQSRGQVEQLSEPAHMPLPQVSQRPQSSGQVEQLSLPLHVASPQVTHRPQSPGQEKQSSPMAQVPSPQVSQRPQSSGQLEQVSAALHTMSPQSSHRPQSAGQVAQLSPSVHMPSPQPPQRPQSAAQVAQVSTPAVQIMSPQLTPGTSGRSPSGTVMPPSTAGPTSRTERPQPAVAATAASRASSQVRVMMPRYAM